MARSVFSLLVLALALAASASAQTTAAASAPLTRPSLVLDQTISNLPTTAQQQVRVLTADFAPGGETVFHTHRFPVTVYVLQGEFRLDLEGQPSRTVKTGEAMVEPANVRMTGYNTSATDRLRVVIFYVSEPGTPFLDPLTPTAAH